MVFEIFNYGCSFFKFTILLSIKTMGANARGGGSYKNMICSLPLNPITKFDLFDRQVSKSGCPAAQLATTPNSYVRKLKTLPTTFWF